VTTTCNKKEQQQGAEIMLNYTPNGRRQQERPLKRQLEEAGTGLSKPNSRRMLMVIMIMNFTLVQIPIRQNLIASH
jgi:hypothetical protein